jgi:hypothetical protein
MAEQKRAHEEELAEQQRAREEELARYQHIISSASQETANRESLLQGSISQLQAQLLEAQAHARNQCNAPASLNRPERLRDFIFSALVPLNLVVQLWTLPRRTLEYPRSRPKSVKWQMRTRPPLHA